MNEFSKHTGRMEPIAIIGMGCRFPYAANSPDSFWEMLCAGTDSITEIPPDRWNLNTFYDPDPATPGTMHIRHGGFLEQIDLFDAQFFGFSPREANNLDPQQRLLLEVVWEALENGGQIPGKLAGTKTSVFIGGFPMDYKLLLHSEMQRELMGLHTSIGSSTTMLANRISHWFDLRGASISLDTACSSSLMTAYLACQSLWTGESDLAVAGGVNVIFKPEWTIAVSKGGFLSPDGRCKAFNERANGYVRGEGAGAVILKPLAKAIKDDDRIYAVILGAAANQDGHTAGITVPNGDAQIALMKKACEQAGIVPRQVQYVEAHGTGTPVGDPIEANAIGTVFSEGRPADEQCIMGTVKTNIGHTEAASGVAGLIKAALCLYHAKIPPNLHFETPNPNIPFAELQLKVPTVIEPFPDSKGVRLAGINSFGFGGANAHLILQNVEKVSSTVFSRQDSQSQLILPLSAHSEDALKDLGKSYQNLLSNTATTLNQFKLYDLCYCASLRRTHHDYRLALLADSTEELTKHIDAFLNGEQYFGIFGGHVQKESKIAFVFSGMGPQWWAMGRQLIAEEPLFKEVIKRCDNLLGKYTKWSLWDELAAEEDVSRINETQIAQPAIFSIQVALAALWDSWGIYPDAIVGHSVGEVAAAYVAGAMSLEDAIRVIFNRSYLQHQTEGQGRMLAVGLPPKDVASILQGYEESVSIAAINSPNAITLAGDTQALEAIEKILTQKDVFCRFLKVNVPYHSPKMEPLKPKLVDALQGINLRPTTTPLFSTVSGQRINGQDLTPDYWANNIRNSVLFAAAIEELAQDGCNVFLEISAHPVLASSIAECLTAAEKQGTILPSLRRKEPERAMMLGTVAKLYTVGHSFDWSRLYPHQGHFVQLPSYPWQRKRYWTESEESREYRLGGASRRTVMGQMVHPLLGSRFESAYPVWDVEIGQQSYLRYLNDHQIQGNAIYPGAGYVEMALAAALEIFAQSCVLENVEFKQALFLNESVTLQLIFDPHLNIFDIYRKSDEHAWILHATGKITPADSKPASVVKLNEIQERCSRKIAGKDCYLQLHKMGLEYGPAFQSIQEIWLGHEEVLGKLELAAELPTEDYQLHPAILDACFQVFTTVIAFAEEEHSVYLPVRIDQLRIYGNVAQTLWTHSHIVEQKVTHLKGDIQLFDESGQLVADIKGFLCRALEIAEDELTAEIRDSLYTYQWELKPQAKTTYAEKPATWLIFADNDGIGQQLAAQFTNSKGTPIIVTPGAAFTTLEAGHFQIRPDSQEDMQSFIKAVSNQSYSDVIYLWSLELKPLDEKNIIEDTIDNLGCNSILHLLKAIVGEQNSPNIWLVTKGNQVIDSEKSLSLAQSALWGLGRVIVNEHPDLRTAMIDLDPECLQADNVQSLFAEIWENDPEDEIAFRKGSRYVHRLTRSSLDDFRQPSILTNQPFCLEFSKQHGSGFGLRATTREAPNFGEIEIQVYVVALDFKYAAKAMTDRVDLGEYFRQPSFGKKCAGKITAIGEGVKGYQLGDEVVAFAADCLRSFTITTAHFVVHKPPELNFAEAATVPLPFLTDLAVDMSQLEKADFITTLFAKVTAILAEEKSLQPSLEVLPVSNASEAFRLMADPQHTGNVVIDMLEPNLVIMPPLVEDLKFSTEGTVLISGGLGGFGLAAAKWLTELGVLHLVLMGRSGAASAQAKETVDAMQKMGVSVKIVKADVSDPEQVATVLSEIKQSMPPLKGVIHAANVYDDAVLLKMESEHFAKVMAPKAAGAWNLHCHTLNDKLDFFVLFSSVAAVIGNPGQGNYVAANSFLDGLALYRRHKLNLPALTINWGAIEDVGYLARNTEVKGHMDKIGAESISSKMALQVLEKLLALNVINVTVARMDWSKWAEHHQAGSSPRFSRLMTTTDTAQVKQQVDFLEKLTAVPVNERRTVLESQVMGLVAQVLDISQSEHIAPQRGFAEMGMDSMLATELKNRLQTAFACILPATLTFKYPNINAIANYFTEDVLSELFSAKETEAVVLQETDEYAELSEDLDHLSDDDVAEQLAREVAAIRQQG